MNNKRFIEYCLNKKGDVKLTIGGMNFNDKVYFIKNILFNGGFNIVLERQALEGINEILDGSYPTKESKEKVYS